MESFWVLATERSQGSQTMGPIPWSSVRYYAREELGLRGRTLGIFWKLISAMDTGFLLFQKREHDRYVRLNKQGGNKGGGDEKVTPYNR